MSRTDRGICGRLIRGTGVDFGRLVCGLTGREVTEDCEEPEDCLPRQARLLLAGSGEIPPQIKGADRDALEIAMGQVRARRSALEEASR